MAKRQSPDPETSWCRDYSNVLELAHWLEDGGVFDDAAAAISYFEKPWKWTDEYNAMRAVSDRSYDDWQDEKDRAEMAALRVEDDDVCERVI